MTEGALAGRRAWIAGGGSGIGAAAAMALSARGCETALSGRNADRLTVTAAKITEAGGTAWSMPLDVADSDAVHHVSGQVGPVDILVASAGINVVHRTLAELTPSDWRQVMGANLDGAFNLTRAVLPGMRGRGGGLIVLISSWTGWRFEAVGGAAYTASKRALGALAEAINAEEGSHNVRATCLYPAETDTAVLDTRPIPPSPERRARMLKAADIGSIVATLAGLPPHVCVNELGSGPIN